MVGPQNLMVIGVIPKMNVIMAQPTTTNSLKLKIQLAKILTIGRVGHKTWSIAICQLLRLSPPRLLLVLLP
ncbi:unnamed protein product [Heterobilharzia americana]|nr:unnamed protein product [Heterobilharzia americana]